MVARYLYRAGLYVGRRLMAPNVSNVDGHYEDLGVFRIHERLLEANGTGWQYSGEEELVVSERCRNRMRELVERRNARHECWGFKDPRAVLFLEEWFGVMEAPHTVGIYRHYSRSVRSLLHRAADEILLSPSRERLRFWREPELAYRMWLAYNRRLLRHLRAHPERTLLVSQEGMLEGFDLVGAITERWGCGLRQPEETGIDPGRVSESALPPPEPSDTLRRELDELYEELQALSLAPAPEPSGDRFGVPNSLCDLERIAEKTEAVKGRIRTTRTFDRVLEKVRTPELSDAEKLAAVREAKRHPYFMAWRTELIRALEERARTSRSPEYYRLLWELCREEGEGSKAREYALMLPVVAKQPFPWHYHLIGMEFLGEGRLEEAERFFDKALSMNPNNPAFHQAKASLALAQCDIRGALDHLERAIALFPDRAIQGKVAAALERAELLDSLEREEELGPELQRISRWLEAHPELPPVFRRRLEALKKPEGVPPTLPESRIRNEWRRQLLERLEKEEVVGMLRRLLDSLPDPLMRCDLLERIDRSLEKEFPGSPQERICIIVLGMHRSGTSCLMGSLEKYGVVPGEISTWNPFNRKGNREHFGVVALNEKLLAYNNASWDNPPEEQLRWNEELREERDRIIEDFLRLDSRVVGFKDPRTVFTLPFWLEGLKRHMDVRLVGTYRTPSSVVASLLNRNRTMGREKALGIWKRYNRRLMEHYRSRPFPIISFDLPPGEYRQELDKIARTLDLELERVEAEEEFYDPDLIHNRTETIRKIEDPDAKALERRLEEYSGYNALFGLKKRLTVIINFYNMRREAPRTLYTLSSGYQNVSPDLYDVVAIDNGSAEALDPEIVRSFGDNFHYLYFRPEHPTPLEAINFCAKAVGSEYIMCMIDGARMLSPGVLGLSMEAWKTSEDPFVYTIGMHLGTELQNHALLNGYDQDEEDHLLESVDWRNDGYELFRISVPAASSRNGFFSPIAESNCFSLRRDRFLALGGYDERFVSPGAGLANLEWFNRVNAEETISPILLLGEASFHQYHGGVATNVPLKESPWNQMQEEHRKIFGERFKALGRRPKYYGMLDERYHRALWSVSDE